MAARASAFGIPRTSISASRPKAGAARRTGPISFGSAAGIISASAGSAPSKSTHTNRSMKG